MSFLKTQASGIQVMQEKYLLNFDLPKTAIVTSPELAEWIGVETCVLKDETQLPTGTFKDRITELLFCYFYQHDIQQYAHCSTGNTGSSLAWGKQQFTQRTGLNFQLILFVAEEQLPYHWIPQDDDIRVVVLEGADYQETKKYCSWFTKYSLKIPELMNFDSSIRQTGNTLGYLEAFEQLYSCKESVTVVAQAISDGSGLNGGYIASHKALAKKWMTKIPAFFAFQPQAADPMVRCFKAGHSEYQDSCSLSTLGPSKAAYIRRRDGKGSYDTLASFIRETEGSMESVSEEEIQDAKEAVQKCTGINAGYTACVSVAGLKKLAAIGKLKKNEKVLVYLTGKDRPLQKNDASLYTVISKAKWQKTLGSI